MERGALFYSFLFFFFFFFTPRESFCFRPRAALGIMRGKEMSSGSNWFLRPFVLGRRVKGRKKRERGRRLTHGRGGKTDKKEANSPWEERDEMALHFGQGVALVCYLHPLTLPSQEIFQSPKGSCRKVDVLPQGRIKKNQPKPSSCFPIMTFCVVFFSFLLQSSTHLSLLLGVQPGS